MLKLPELMLNPVEIEERLRGLKDQDEKLAKLLQYSPSTKGKPMNGELISVREEDKAFDPLSYSPEELTQYVKDEITRLQDETDVQKQKERLVDLFGFIDTVTLIKTVYGQEVHSAAEILATPQYAKILSYFQKSATYTFELFVQEDGTLQASGSEIYKRCLKLASLGSVIYSPELLGREGEAEGTTIARLQKYIGRILPEHIQALTEGKPVPTDIFDLEQEKTEFVLFLHAMGMGPNNDWKMAVAVRTLIEEDINPGEPGVQLAKDKDNFTATYPHLVEKMKQKKRAYLDSLKQGVSPEQLDAQALQEAVLEVEKDIIEFSANFFAYTIDDAEDLKRRDKALPNGMTHERIHLILQKAVEKISTRRKHGIPPWGEGQHMPQNPREAAQTSVEFINRTTLLDKLTELMRNKSFLETVAERIKREYLTRSQLKRLDYAKLMRQAEQRTPADEKALLAYAKNTVGFLSVLQTTLDRVQERLDNYEASNIRPVLQDIVDNRLKVANQYDDPVEIGCRTAHGLWYGSQIFLGRESRDVVMPFDNLSDLEKTKDWEQIQAAARYILEQKSGDISLDELIALYSNRKFMVGCAEACDANYKRVAIPEEVAKLRAKDEVEGNPVQSDDVYIQMLKGDDNKAWLFQPLLRPDQREYLINDEKAGYGNGDKQVMYGLNTVAFASLQELLVSLSKDRPLENMIQILKEIIDDRDPHIRQIAGRWQKMQYLMMKIFAGEADTVNTDSLKISASGNESLASSQDRSEDWNQVWGAAKILLEKLQAQDEGSEAMQADAPDTGTRS